MNRIKSLTLPLLVLFSLLPNVAMAFEYVRGCNNGSGYVWSANQLPIQWKINSAGSDNMAFDKVKTIFETSFGAWSDPCCSRFTDNYAGTTTKTALSNNFEVVLSFEEQSWPRELGDPNGGVIAVTLLRFGSGCRIVDAPIVFNGIAHNFTDQCNANACAGGGTDLQGVATHEIGHLLGLDHSPISTATMYYAYRGGNIARTLHQDDRDGVCDLYPNVCSCTRDDQCLGDREKCVNRRCEFVPCTSDTECESPLVCNRQSGKCDVPPCSNDAACGAGFQCVNTKCVSTCPVCRPCNSANECGGNGSCVDFNGDGAGECITFCQQDTGLCPGDSLCYEVPIQGETYQLCLNPNANSAGICPETYTCDGTVVNDPCENVTCPNGQFCESGRCFENPNDCANINCAAGKVCDRGACIPDPNDCANISCATGKVCLNGQCVASMTGSDMGKNDMGKSDMGQDMNDTSIIIVKPKNTQTGTNGICATTTLPKHAPVHLPWILLGTLGFWAHRRRKRG